MGVKGGNGDICNTFNSAYKLKINKNNLPKIKKKEKMMVPGKDQALRKRSGFEEKTRI